MRQRTSGHPARPDVAWSGLQPLEPRVLLSSPGALQVGGLIEGLAFHDHNGNGAFDRDLYSIDRDDNLLRRIDPADGSTLDAVLLTLEGQVIMRSTGLATHPVTQDLYGILNLQGANVRELVTINPSTGAATSIGNLGDKFSGITFANDGTLFGVTGDGADVPESLYSIDINDASATLISELGNGTDGEVIALNPLDGLIYHASGGEGDDEIQIFETINPQTLEVTNVPLSGFEFDEATALVHRGQGEFFLSDLGDLVSNLAVINSLGQATFTAELDHVSKGLAFVADQPLEGRTIYLDLNANGALDDGEPQATTDANGMYAISDLDDDT